MVLFCIHCNVLSSSEDKMKEHFSSEYHKFNTMTDEEKLWKYRLLAQCLSIATERILTLTSKYESKLEMEIEDIEKTVEEVLELSRSVIANPVSQVEENVQELPSVRVKNVQKDVSAGGNPTLQRESNPHCDALPHQWMQYTSFGNLSCSSEDFASEADCVCGKPHGWIRLSNSGSLNTSSECITIGKDPFFDKRCKRMQRANLDALRSSPERDCICHKLGPSKAKRELQLHHHNIRSSFSSEESIIPKTTCAVSSHISDYFCSTNKLDSTVSHGTIKNDLISVNDLENEMDKEISDLNSSSEECRADIMCNEGHILESSVQSKEESRFSATIISEISGSPLPQVQVKTKVCKKCNKQIIQCKCIKRKFKKMLVNFFGKLSSWRS